MRSNVASSRASFTSVAASAALNVSRFSRPSSAVAASASIASDGEMRTSARRRSPMNSRIRSSTGSGLGQVREHLVEGALHALEVLLVLHEHGQRRLDQLGVELLGVENHERARPVERLRDGWGLAAIHRADLAYRG